VCSAKLESNALFGGAGLSSWRELAKAGHGRAETTEEREERQRVIDGRLGTRATAQSMESGVEDGR
jgi:hypothetical protein